MRRIIIVFFIINCICVGKGGLANLNSDEVYINRFDNLPEILKPFSLNYRLDKDYLQNVFPGSFITFNKEKTLNKIFIQNAKLEILKEVSDVWVEILLCENVIKRILIGKSSTLPTDDELFMKRLYQVVFKKLHEGFGGKNRKKINVKSEYQKVEEALWQFEKYKIYISLTKIPKGFSEEYQGSGHAFNLTICIE